MFLSCQRDAAGVAVLGLRSAEKGHGFDSFHRYSEARHLLGQVFGHEAVRVLSRQVGEFFASQLVRQRHRQLAQPRAGNYPRFHDSRGVQGNLAMKT